MRRRVIAIIQPVYLPWLGYFEQMAYADHFVFYDEVQYTRQDWRNRNRILTKSGPIWLTVPVSKKGLGTRINQVAIDNSRNWPQKHLRSISQNYRKANHCEPCYALIETFLSQLWINLADLDIALIRALCAHLDIDTDTSLASAIPKDPELYASTPTDAEAGKLYKRNMRVIEVCQHHDADIFYEGAKGAEYIDAGLFRKHGIEVVFQDYRHPVYPQRHACFYSHMSVIDLIMNTGPQAREILLSSPVPDGLVTCPT